MAKYHAWMGINHWGVCAFLEKVKASDLKAVKEYCSWIEKGAADCKYCIHA
jgi:hypothetical protein